MQRTPGVEQHPVEALDRRRGADRVRERGDFWRAAFGAQQFECVFDLLHHAQRHERLVDALPRERFGQVPPQRLWFDLEVDAQGLARLATAPVGAAVVDQPAIAVAHRDVDLAAVAAGCVAGRQIDVVRTVAVAQPETEHGLVGRVGIVSFNTQAENTLTVVAAGDFPGHMEDVIVHGLHSNAAGAEVPGPCQPI